MSTTSTTSHKQREEHLKREGALVERARAKEVISRHAREFQSRNVDVDQRVAAALVEIMRELDLPTIGG